jgi:tetratricopeptide (TPR) repeat protein
VATQSTPMPDDVRLPIYAVFSEAKQAAAAGDHARAEQLCEDAWGRIPEPKFGWDVTYVCLGAFVKYMGASRSYDKPIEAVNAYLGSPYYAEYQDGPYFWLGSLYYEKGDLARAFEYFERANAMSKGRCFVEEDPRYKAFFRTCKTRPKQQPS